MSVTTDTNVKIDTENIIMGLSLLLAISITIMRASLGKQKRHFKLHCLDIYQTMQRYGIEREDIAGLVKFHSPMAKALGKIFTGEASSGVKRVSYGLKADRQVEGEAKLHHKDGWTAIAFWDRSVDSRKNSNSVFVIEGIHTFGEAKEIAKLSYPSIWKRFSFSVREG